MKLKLVLAVAVVAGAAVLTATAERAEPCCNVKSFDARTRMVTVVDNKTGCSYEFQAKTAADLVGLKVGSAITLDVKLLTDPAGLINGRTAGLAKKPAEPINTRPAEPVGRPADPINGRPADLAKKPSEPINGRPAEPVGKPAEPISERPVRGVAATASAACGSNVARNAKTKTLCKRMTGPNSWEYVTCP